jgi:hypothetical protein
LARRVNTLDFVVEMRYRGQRRDAAAFATRLVFMKINIKG